MTVILPVMFYCPPGPAGPGFPAGPAGPADPPDPVGSSSPFSPLPPGPPGLAGSPGPDVPAGPCNYKTNINYVKTRSVSRGFIMLKPTKIFEELRDIWPCYFTLQIAKDKHADQTARMHRLICAFLVRNQEKSGFLVSMPIWCWSPGFLASPWLRACKLYKKAAL